MSPGVSPAVAAAPTLTVGGSLSPAFVAVGSDGYAIVAGVLAVLLAVVHLYAVRLWFIDVVPRSRLLSFGGGVSVAYVFVHLIPELATTERFDEYPLAHPAMTEDSVYLVALAGFVVFYGLERAIVRSKEPSPETDEPPRGVYWVHVTSFASYNALIGYLLFHREAAGVVPLLAFGGAMALHFLVNDYALRRHYQDAYHDTGRWLLAGAVVAGGIAGWLTTFHRAPLDALFAFLAGGIILNTIKEELPEHRQSRFTSFALGSALYAGLLLLV